MVPVHTAEVQEKKPELRQPELLIMDSKSACLFASEEDAVSSKVACYANMSKKIVGNKVGQSVPHSRDVKTNGGIHQK